MLLYSNIERVMNLRNIISDVKDFDKIRLAIRLLEKSCFYTVYDKNFN